MCAASASALIPLYNEGKQYWQDLTEECERYVECVNATLVRNGVTADGLLQCAAAPDRLHMVRAKCPATTVTLSLNFFSWGPVIAGVICEQQTQGRSFLPQEFELPIAMDFDNKAAIDALLVI